MIAVFKSKPGKRLVQVISFAAALALGASVVLNLIFRRFLVPDVSTIALVNGIPISRAELQRKIAQEEYYEKIMGGRMPRAQGTAHDRAYKQLVHQKVLYAAAQESGFNLSPDYIVKKIESPTFWFQSLLDVTLPGYFTNNTVDYQGLLKALQKQGISAKALEEMIEERLKGQLMLLMASGAAYTPEWQLKDMFERFYGGKKLLLLKVPVALFLERVQEEVRAKKTPDAELTKILQEFYEQENNQARKYWSPERRTGTVWTFDHVADDFVQKAQQVLDAGDEDFKKFVEEHKGEKSQLGPTERKNELLSKKLFELKKGQRGVAVSKDKEAKGRGFIVEVTTIDSPEPIPFDQVRARVAQDYATKQAQEKMKQELEKLAQLSDQERAAWLKKWGGSERVTGVITLDNQESYKELMNEKLGLDLLLTELMKKNDTAVRTMPEYGYFLRVEELTPFQQEEYNKKRKELMNMLVNGEMNRLGAEFVANLEKSGTLTKSTSQTQQTRLR